MLGTMRPASTAVLNTCANFDLVKAANRVRRLNRANGTTRRHWLRRNDVMNGYVHSYVRIMEFVRVKERMCVRASFAWLDVKIYAKSMYTKCCIKLVSAKTQKRVNAH